MFDLRPLRSASFRHLAAAYWVNEFGTWIGEIALTILIYDRTHSPLGTAALFLALRFAPALIAPLLTTRIEALPMRVVLTTLYVLEAILFAAIAAITRHFSMPAVLALAAADGALAIAAKALTRSATAAGLTEVGLLRDGNGILNLGLMASTAGAPVIAAGLVAWKGVQPALLVDAATFLVTALIVASAPGIRVVTDREAGVIGRAQAGLATVRRRTDVRRLLIALALVMLLSSVPIPIEVVFAKHTLHASDTGYGLLLGAWGLGMIAGAALFATIGARRLTALFAAGMIVMAAGYGALAVAPTLALACIGSAIGGVGNGVGWVAAVTALQERVAMSTQSAVMALMEGLNQLMPGIGFAIGGTVTELFSPRIAYAVAAVGVAIVMVVFALRPVDQIHLELVADDPRRPVDPVIVSSGPEETSPPDRSHNLPNLTTG